MEITIKENSREMEERMKENSREMEKRIKENTMEINNKIDKIESTLTMMTLIFSVGRITPEISAAIIDVAKNNKPNNVTSQI